ncbi:MAG TPA: GH32 C-terminal domain-containing protein [Candidatus Hydrogenedentes bacterium]|nr:GH32 C-terminal domain-containing protein [Candidatus Hydrogenedentota bacterium]HPG68424.1 GH32 C-terminal domain-containing protein [Candidatus Hydrogenedentota bacterium]
MDGAAIALISLLLMFAMLSVSAWADDALLNDKTLVVWAAPSTLDQSGGSALTIDDLHNNFDAIVFGELTPKKWMPGSNGFCRTEKEQGDWPEETAGPAEFVQIAIVYSGNHVTAYRNGKPFADYEHNQPHAFPLGSGILIGNRHLLDGKPTGDSFNGIIQDARVYDTALDAGTLAQLKPGEAGGPEPWAWWAFCQGDLIPDRTGRFGNVKLVGDIRLVARGLEVKGAHSLFLAQPGAEGAATPPLDWRHSSAVPDSVVLSTRLFRERLLADPYRPGYHFAMPEDWGRPGDANGAFYANGRYHLMYLYERKQSGFCWGHISSKDLIHWRHHPDSIGPGDGDEGCFSGGAFVDDDGTAYLSYWMLWGARGLGLAKSRDPHYDHFEKCAENPVIASTEWGITEVKDENGNPVIYGSADPTNIWKKDGVYYIAAGNLLVLNKYGRDKNSPPNMQGDWLDLFKSTDLKDWQYVHRFYERNPEWTDAGEDNMCPSFLPLPASAEGGAPSGKYLLLFIAHNRGTQFYVGDYDTANDTFVPNNHGRMSWVDNTYFAPEALIDAQGRQIMWAWLLDNPEGEEAKGWSGVYGLPRTLWLGEDGTLRMAPVPELAMLRQSERVWNDITLADGEMKPLADIDGESCELELAIRPGAAKQCGVKVRTSPGGEEETVLYYDADSHELVFDATHSGVTGQRVVERAPFELGGDDVLRLRVFVDKSVVEIYANDRQAIGRRVYPGRDDSLGIALFANGGEAAFTSVKAWDMMPSNPY